MAKLSLRGVLLWVALGCGSSQAFQATDGGNGDKQQIETSASVINYVVMRQAILKASDFQLCLINLELANEQEKRFVTHFDTYQDAIEKLANEVAAELKRRDIEHVFGGNGSGEYSVSEDYIKAREKAVRIIANARRQFDKELELLKGAISSELLPEQNRFWQAALRKWRRTMLFDLDGGESVSQDLWRHIDLVELFHDSIKTGGELEPLFDPDSLWHEHPGGEKARIDINDALHQYEVYIEDHAKIHYVKYWRLIDEILLCLPSQDFKKLRRLHRDRMQLWKKVYREGLDATRRITLVVSETLGEGAAQSWEARFFTRYYPRTDHVVSTEILYRWIMDSLELELENQEWITAEFKDYKLRDHALRRQSRQESFDIRMSTSPMTPEYSFFAPMTERKAELEDKRKEIAQSANRRLRLLLPPSFAEAFNTEMAAVMKSEGVGRYGRY